MANRMYNEALTQLLNQSLDLVNDTIRVMLVDNTYTFDPDDDFVDEGGGSDPQDAEISGTGYVAGHGNSGRQAVATISIVKDDANDRAEVQVSSNNTWSSLDAGTVAAAIIIREGGSDDTDALLIAYIDTSNPDFPVVTVGADFTIQWNAEGLIQLPA